MARVPILQISAFLRRYRNTSWFADVVENAFPGSGQAVLDELIEEGYVDPSSQPGIFKVTVKGEAFAKLTLAHHVPRRTRD